MSFGTFSTNLAQRLGYVHQDLNLLLRGRDGVLGLDNAGPQACDGLFESLILVVRSAEGPGAPFLLYLSYSSCSSS